jgi:hypothetical protein
MPAGVNTVESNVSHRIPPDDEPVLLEDFTPYDPPDPPSIQGACNRCGYRGTVYPGRHGGYRCAVCFGLQWGWMPKRD